MNPYEKRKAYLKRAAETLEKQKAEEALKEAEYYEKRTTGTSWLVFKIGAIFCAILSIVLTFDLFVDGDTVSMPEGTYDYRRIPHEKVYAAVWVGDDIYRPHYEDFVSVDYSSFTVTESLITGAGKYISFTAHTLDTPQRFSAFRQYSVFNWFPYVQIMLLIPLFVFLFKRQKAWFNYMRILCLFLIMPGGVLILLFQLF